MFHNKISMFDFIYYNYISMYTYKKQKPMVKNKKNK